MKESLMRRKKKKHKSYKMELSTSNLTNIQNSSNLKSLNTFPSILYNYELIYFLILKVFQQYFCSAVFPLDFPKFFSLLIILPPFLFRYDSQY